MKLFNFNKKGFSLLSENPILIFTFLLLIVSIVLQNQFSISSNETFETSFKEINYAYPKAVVTSFINYPLTLETKKKFGLDENGNYTIKNLMEKFHNDKIEEEINLYYNNYLDFLENDNSINKFKEFSNSNFVNSESLKVNSNLFKNFQEANSFLEQKINSLKNDEYFLYISCPVKDDLKDYYDVCIWEIQFN
jgi:hypothetical protein